MFISHCIVSCQLYLLASFYPLLCTQSIEYLVTMVSVWGSSGTSRKRNTEFISRSFDLSLGDGDSPVCGTILQGVLFYTIVCIMIVPHSKIITYYVLLLNSTTCINLCLARYQQYVCYINILSDLEQISWEFTNSILQYITIEIWMILIISYL